MNTDQFDDLDRREEVEDAAKYRETFPQRKAEIKQRIDNLNKLLDRDPPPTYSEVSEAIDRINHPNDRRM